MKSDTDSIKSEKAFWEEVQAQSPSNYEAARNLIDRYRQSKKIKFNLNKNSIAVRLYIQETGIDTSLFFVNKQTQVNVHPNTIELKLKRAGINPVLVNSYRSAMREMLQADQDRKEFACQIEEVNIQQFIATVDGFIESIQTAERID